MISVVLERLVKEAEGSAEEEDEEDGEISPSQFSACYLALQKRNILQCLKRRLFKSRSFGRVESQPYSEVPCTYETLEQMRRIGGFGEMLEDHVDKVTRESPR
jgi:hypothetical protein